MSNRRRSKIDGGGSETERRRRRLDQGRQPMRRGRGAAAAVVLGVALVAAACGAGSGSGQKELRFDQGASPGPKSIVQLGDSIAAGEGTLYGYKYDSGKKQWTGGDINVKWPDPYPECHVSGDEYGKRVAKAFGASFTQFACTGASFDNGITAPMVVSGKTRRPAEFGDFAKKTNINAEYDAAKPDLVLVTLGADDVDFGDIVEDCVKNAYKHYFGGRFVPLQCVEDNPGDSVKTHYFDVLPAVKKNYVTLATWIQDRAVANSVPVPKVVFTTYANPLPKSGTKCDDVNYLYPEQIDYLASLLQDMNKLIQSTVKDVNKRKPGVAVADIEKVYQAENDDHRWCSSTPWAYGLSIYRFSEPSSFYSLAPFHPTPDGQEAIAEAVIPTVARLFNTDIPTTTTSAPGSSPS